MASRQQRRTFISYSRVNKEFAIKLARELRSDGYLIWFDQFDIPTGSRWDDQVEKALEECEIFLLILTPAAIASQNVKDEIGYAIDNRKHILPVLLENCNVPLRLRRFQYVDFTTKNFDDGIESAKQLLTNFINEDTLPRIEVPATLQAKEAQPKAEAERSAKEKSAREATAETERSAKQERDRKALEEAGKLAKQKSERESKTKLEQMIPAKIKAGMASNEGIQKRPLSQGLIIGIVVIVGLVIAGMGINALSNRAATAATESPLVTDPAIEVITRENTATSTPVAATEESATATNTPIPPTQAIPSKFLKINFAQNTVMDVFDVAEIGLGENKIIDRALSDKGLALTLNGSDLYLYYFYKPFIYQDIAVKVQVENLGIINKNNVSLICRKTNSTWYEFSVTSDGLWFLFDYNESNVKRYTMIGNGGSTAIKTGQNVNEYEMKCIGNEISLYINGQKAKTIKNDLYAEGQVGFNISSLDLFPVEINVSEFEMSKP